MTEYNYKYNLVKFWAILGVISIHIFLGSRFLFYDKFTLDWFLSVLIYIFSRVSVPLFFMVSGALLLNKQESIYNLLFKRIGRILLFLVFWSFFYYFFFKYYCLRTEPIDVLKSIFWPETLPHLWFLFVLLGLYLMTPIYRLFVQYASTNIIIYYLCIWGFFAGFHEIFLYFFGVNIGDGIGLFPTVLSSYSGYYILGYLLSNRICDLKIEQPFLILIYFLGFLSSFVLNIYENIPNRNLVPYADRFLIFTNINIILMTIPMFLWIYNINIKNTFLTNIINKIGIYIFGIYVIHEAILQILRLSHVGNNITHSLLYWIIYLLLTFITSLILSIIIKRMVKVII